MSGATWPFTSESARRIRELEAENQRLRGALEEILGMQAIDALIDVRDAAREALAGGAE